ncbi:MAG: 30S ribosomal protein S20 [Candidatus Doudnabacteria bacterium RIFCSPHIGHO2_01_FULL_49_9]|uniref:Small ribosomal subunit protein bS20 n=1 Tax=Candidatus Doudnabacteria bacterium RIFCSPHIGHO2_01_FULL_49_9 TaxID=1817827 RepID=A0A1F5NXZ6_9BACT|nr:MAG: 30S ribosomal protein S20 [Candidatus Doudnabacteria bacterium RIFCSPHIGHO2_01_FULL_49_9]
MPNTKSAIKAMRGSARKRVFNLVTINKYKDAVKAVRKALTGKKKDEAITALQNAYKQLDKAVKKHVIKKKKSARLKSRLAKAIAKI